MLHVLFTTQEPGRASYAILIITHENKEEEKPVDILQIKRQFQRDASIQTSHIEHENTQETHHSTITLTVRGRITQTSYRIQTSHIKHDNAQEAQLGDTTFKHHANSL